MTCRRLLRAGPRPGVAYVAVVRVKAEVVGDVILARPNVGEGMLGVLLDPWVRRGSR
jgi:hypothetical protein